MATDNPFYLTRIECPICKTLNEFETVRVGAYVEKGRDTDFCPTEIEWRYPRYQSANPLAYFTATCSHCYYTREFNNSYKEWQSDGNFRTYRLKTVKEKHLEQLATADSFVKQIGEAIDLADYPNESAILKLHLAIFDELLCERPNQVDLGRFYLRIGWVFRRMAAGDNPDSTFVRRSMREVDSRCDAMVQTMDQLRRDTQIYSRHLSAHFETDQVSAPAKAQMMPFREKFETHLAQLQESLDQSEQHLEALKQQMNEYKAASVGATGSGFGRFASFGDFLHDVKNAWDGIVADENEALRAAVDHYKKAFVDGRSIAAGNQQIQASYLIAELSRRIGDHEEAKQYFNTTIKCGQEFIYKNRRDQSRTALARKILELAIEQGRENMEALKTG